MKTLRDFVNKSLIVKEGSQELGRLDQLINLIFKLDGSSAEMARSLRTTLEENKRMGGGCPQGIFNRFVTASLLPQLIDLTDHAIEQKEIELAIRHSL